MTLQAESPTEPLARETPRNEWVAVCTKRQLIPERGVAVLVRDQQVALFRVTGTDPRTGEPADFV